MNAWEWVSQQLEIRARESKEKEAEEKLSDALDRVLSKEGGVQEHLDQLVSILADVRVGQSCSIESHEAQKHTANPVFQYLAYQSFHGEPGIYYFNCSKCGSTLAIKREQMKSCLKEAKRVIEGFEVAINHIEDLLDRTV